MIRHTTANANQYSNNRIYTLIQQAHCRCAARDKNRFIIIMYKSQRNEQKQIVQTSQSNRIDENGT